MNVTHSLRDNSNDMRESLELESFRKGKFGREAMENGFGKTKGFESRWTWTMKVRGCSLVEEEDAMARRERKERRESIVKEWKWG
ncbi:hypothetical protein OIU79_008139 [Salix purpurea]|uniref:Uncharacterized protein n=1 Tax=Salix purpurea TaxID=77065 RepID=A0A9Q0YVR1_SALPP|nr:hypothetical protein OIU79_008139 [Salix purpurea]